MGIHDEIDAHTRLVLYGRFAQSLFAYDYSRFAYVLQQLIHILYVRSRLDASQSIQFLKWDFVCWINQLNVNCCFGVKLPLYS